MSDDKENVKIHIIEPFDFNKFDSNEFDRILSIFDWSLKNRDIDFHFVEGSFSEVYPPLLIAYWSYLITNECKLKIFFSPDNFTSWKYYKTSGENWESILSSAKDWSKEPMRPPFIVNSNDREKALEFGKKYTRTFRY